MDNPNNREKRLPPGSGFVIGCMWAVPAWVLVWIIMLVVSMWRAGVVL